MKFIFLFTVLSSLTFISCNKPLEEGELSTIPTNLTVVSQGSFSGDSHPTSGTVKLSKDAAGKKYLVFENFKSDPGPDIRIWLADGKAAKNYVEVSKQVKLGSYALELSSSTDTAKLTYVLVWCKAFSVLFGSAQLK